MSHPVEAASSLPRRPVAQRDRLWPLLLGLVVLLAVGFWFSHSAFYQPGTALSYWTGVAGGVCMLLLFLYPLRKHAAWFNIGSMSRWFRVHMWLGIAGPWLILVHAQFKTHSLNASVAFYSMLLVAGSGIIGRFIYTRIHFGLYGTAMRLQDWYVQLEKDLAALPIGTTAQQQFSHHLRQREQVVMAQQTALWKLFAQPWALRWQATQWRQQLKQLNVPASYIEKVTVCTDHLRAAARFRMYERLFRWWHLLHVPFVFTLVLSAIFHVVSVHMF